MIGHNQSQPTCTGALASFPNLPALSHGFEKVASLLPVFKVKEYRQRYGDNQPPNVLNLALHVFNEQDDMAEGVWSEKITALVNVQRECLIKWGVH